MNQIHTRFVTFDKAGNFIPEQATIFLYEVSPQAAISKVEDIPEINRTASVALKNRNAFAYLSAHLDTFDMVAEDDTLEPVDCIVFVYEDNMVTKISYVGYDIVDKNTISIFPIGEDENPMFVKGLYVNLLRESMLQN